MSTVAVAPARPATLQDVARLVTDTVGSPNTRRAYSRSLASFFRWFHDRGAGILSKATVQWYLRERRDSGAGPVALNQDLTVIRRFACEAADNGLLGADVAAAIGRIAPAKRLGKRTGRWLTLEQARALVAAPDLRTLAGLRDRAMLALLLECGLRREEACQVDVTQLQQRDGRWVLADLAGKGGRVRTVPVPARAAERIREWIAAGLGQHGLSPEHGHAPAGPILRQVHGSRVVGTGLTPGAVYKRVWFYARGLGLEIAPHDLRRTFGRLTFQHGARLEQIQQALGHGSIKTTEVYLGTALDLEHAACDAVSMEG